MRRIAWSVLAAGIRAAGADAVEVLGDPSVVDGTAVVPMVELVTTVELVSVVG